MVVNAELKACTITAMSAEFTTSARSCVPIVKPTMMAAVVATPASLPLIIDRNSSLSNGNLYLRAIVFR